MYKKVINNQDLQEFNRIWVTCWDEKGFELEFLDAKEQYLVKNTLGEYVGTVEFLLLSEEINVAYPFLNLPEIKNNRNKVEEINKVSILKEHRGKNLRTLMHLIFWYAIKNNVKYYVALIEPTFFKAIRYYYKIPLLHIGEEIYYKGDTCVPIVIDVEKTMEMKENFNWYDEKLMSEVSDGVDIRV